MNVGSFAGKIISPSGEKVGKITKKGEIIDTQSGVPIASITPLGQVTTFEGNVLGTVAQGDRFKAYQLAKQPIMAHVTNDLASDAQQNLSDSAGAYAGTVTTSENEPIASIALNGAITDLTSHKIIGYVNAQGQVTALNHTILGTVGPDDKFAAYNLARKSVSF
ncbi:icme protein [Lasius niger]|uniref:Icme protein n=1 Tax=Lasius niger TaxID=67767 RepID=A0A0J7KER2_LASNI|nr:icme protein [Lasius niger]